MVRESRLTLLLTVTLIFASALPIFAQEELTIAAAADLQPVMKEIASRFETNTGSKVKLVFGSSGNFFAQLQNGAPFDVFFSADLEYPKKLEAQGLTEPGSLYECAIGKIVLWVPSNSPIDVSKGLSVVADPQIRRLAIANPAHAPYGRAAKTVLGKAELWQSVSSKLVLGENISQTAQFANSGNADAAILALSLVLAPAMKGNGTYFMIPQELYPPLRQAAVVMKASAHKKSALRFVEFLESAETQSLFAENGFQRPEKAQ
ncbi:MAG: molybdate ABC transporter substrate-binding protein [Acidobacteria bacterium]|nr:MAG: molybdate ABC transporter substrate-binding protein [Acidobacteriota bacterium]PYY22506.1 MAG: molybdate ABC transporter substrate-binding protein [Acidobacteriota bacterium]